MALVVEDGTGLSNAESYISVTDADTYIASYKGADAAWDAATTGEKEIAARQATQYLDGLYNWRGRRLEADQALGLPTTGGYDDDGIAIEGVPTKVTHATAEAMFLVINGTSLSVDTTKSDQAVSETVGPISVTYAAGASAQPSFPVVGRLVKSYIVPSSRIERS